nr:immunoglobulin heavy chain junction region [Macaca mulatta]
CVKDCTNSHCASHWGGLSLDVW